jgi:hypothetical protein
MTSKVPQPAYAALKCLGLGVEEMAPCGLVYIDESEYIRQMSRPDSTWRCPHCRGEAIFDEDTWDELHPHEGDNE